MFNSFFHLQDNPFSETPNLRCYFAGNTQLSALANLFTAIDGNRAFGLVTGEVGMGKTILGRVMLRLLQERKFNTALILHPIYDGPALVEQICAEFGIAISPSSPKANLDALVKGFLDAASAGRKSVIVIDEAHKLSFEALETLCLLTNLETDAAKIVQVILLAQPEIETKLEAHHLRQIRQRMFSQFQIQAFSVKETGMYITHRIELAGARNFVRFDDSAIQLLHKSSGGVPRVLNFFAELTLLAAQSRQTRFIDKSIVQLALKGQMTSSRPGLFRRLFDLS